MGCRVSRVNPIPVSATHKSIELITLISISVGSLIAPEEDAQDDEDGRRAWLIGARACFLHETNRERNKVGMRTYI